MERGRTFATGSIVRRRGVLGIIGNVLMVGGGGSRTECNLWRGDWRTKKKKRFHRGKGCLP